MQGARSCERYALLGRKEGRKESQRHKGGMVPLPTDTNPAGLPSLHVQAKALVQAALEAGSRMDTRRCVISQVGGWVGVQGSHPELSR